MASVALMVRHIDFYPRPPRGGRHVVQVCKLGDIEFLSTPSARRATGQSLRQEPLRKNFYPRPPRGGRPLADLGCTITSEFLSTPSARRATVSVGYRIDTIEISIHALREEGDQPALPPRSCGSYFYPRPPRGGRRGARREVWRQYIFLSTPSARRATRSAAAVQFFQGFLSTPSARRATCLLGSFGGHKFISIHALREEGDSSQLGHRAHRLDFYPRPPRGGRQAS